MSTQLSEQRALLKVLLTGAVAMSLRTNMRSSTECVSKVSIGAIRGGQPFIPITSPEHCFLYVDVRLTPEQTATEVERKLRAELDSINVPFRLECFRYRRGYHAVGAEHLLRVLGEAQQVESGQELGGVAAGQASSWRRHEPIPRARDSRRQLWALGRPRWCSVLDQDRRLDACSQDVRADSSGLVLCARGFQRSRLIRKDST